MLLLTRSIGEKLKIGDNVTVTVLGFKGKQIRIGIDAPRDISVNREECTSANQNGMCLDLQGACGSL
jgi:carbon storage regulator